MSANAAAAEPGRVAARPERTTTFSGMWLIGGAMVASGVLTYAYLVLAARALGPERYGQIGVLWGGIFIAAIVLFRPLEQTTSRSVADRLARGDEVRSVLRAVLLIAAALVLGGAIIGAISWTLLTRRLFLGSDQLTGVLLLGVAAYGFAYVVRGLLGGVRWFAGYSLGLLADSAGRLLAAAPLVIVGSRSIAAGAMVVAGLAGALVPLVVGRSRLRQFTQHGPGAPFRLRTAFAFAAPATVIAASDQLLVNGGPLVVIASGGSSKTAGVVFAATMLVRAPVYVFQGLAASLLPNLTHLHATQSRRVFQRAVAKTTAVLMGAGVVIIAVAAIGGSALMSGLYGSRFAAGRVELALLAASVAFYLPAGTFAQALLALDRGTAAAWSWASASVVFLALYALAPGSALMRVSIALAVALFVAAAALGVLLLVDRRQNRSQEEAR